MTGVERWWFNLLVSGQLPFVNQNDNGYMVVKEKLYQDFVDAQKRINDKHRCDPRSFGMQFAALIPKLDNGKIQYYPNGKVISMIKHTDKYNAGKERLNVYTIPKLDVCRALMDFRLKSKYNWGDDNDVWEYPTFTDRNIMSTHNLF
jgi:hypothetical protein